MWKVEVAYFKALSQYLLTETEQNYEDSVWTEFRTRDFPKSEEY